MRLQLRKPAQSLNKAYARQAVTREQMDKFRRVLAGLFSRVNEKESEDYQRTIVADFLRDVFDAEAFDLSAQEGVDISIQPKSVTQASTEKVSSGASVSAVEVPSVVVETRKVFAGEMMTPLKNNVRALHELILHYFENAERDQPTVIRQLIITDVYNWFLFDEVDFRRFFYNNARLKKLYQIKQQQQKENTFFFAETARILRDLDAEIPVTYMNLRQTADSLNRVSEPGNRALLTAFKLLSPEHLVKRPFDNGTGSFNQRFYDELLWIIGLRETPTAKIGPRIDRLPQDERLEGSLLEDTIQQLQARNVLGSGDDWTDYGANEDEQLFAVGLDLCLTWINRIFLLKVLEGQLRNCYPDEPPRPFLSVRCIDNFASLSELFATLTIPVEQRSVDAINRFGRVPHLGSSLFDKTDLEQKTLTVDALTATLELPLFGQTALRSSPNEPQTGSLATLPYLLTFLDAYDFSADGSVEVVDADKPSIRAATLSVTLERLNEYRNGSLPIPAAVTAYTVQEALRRAILSKFTTLSESIDPSIPNLSGATSLTELKSLFRDAQPDALLRLNTIVNSLRLVDPAVGSGRFLLSALNELIAFKAELGILVDINGQRLPQLAISVVDGDLLMTNEDGELFTYTGTEEDNAAYSPFERQRIQKTMFHEKQTLIENCLFGVDRAPGSVATYQVRLWIELLKSLYRPSAEPQYLTVPKDQFVNRTMVSDADDSPDGVALRLTPNSNVGNSLVSRISVDFRVESLSSLSAREKLQVDLEQYKADLLTRKQRHDNAGDTETRTRINAFEESIKLLLPTDQKEIASIRRMEAKLAQSTLTFDFVDNDDQFRKLNEQLAVRKQALANQQRLFQQAVEWRFLFPDVLDDAGNYVGFDAVIGCPVYPRSGDFSRYKSYLQKAFPNTYTSKADPYILFVELGMRLLKPDGHLAYVLPAKWMQASTASKLRNWLTTRHIEQVLDYSSLLTTEQNTSSTSVLFVSNTEATPTFQAVKIDALDRNADNAAVTGQTVEIAVASLQDTPWKLFTANN